MPFLHGNERLSHSSGIKFPRMKMMKKSCNWVKISKTDDMKKSWMVFALRELCSRSNLGPATKHTELCEEEKIRAFYFRDSTFRTFFFRNMHYFSKPGTGDK